MSTRAPCVICGGQVLLYGRKTCGKPCAGVLNGRRASARMTRLHQEPEFQKARNARSSAVLTKLWQQPEFVENQKTVVGPANAARMYAETETMERRGAINAAILRYATEAFSRSDESRRLLSERTKHYRDLHPYDADIHGHYNRDYTGFISSLVMNDPAVRAAHDVGMKEMIPEATRLYREGKLRVAQTDKCLSRASDEKDSTHG
mgnify:FL=1